MTLLTPGRTAVGFTLLLAFWGYTRWDNFRQDAAAFRALPRIAEAQRLAHSGHVAAALRSAAEALAHQPDNAAALTLLRRLRLLAQIELVTTSLASAPRAVTQQLRRYTLPRSTPPESATAPILAAGKTIDPDPPSLVMEAATLSYVWPELSSSFAPVASLPPETAAYAALQAGEVETAVSLFQRALAAQPSGQLAADLAYASLRLGRRREAARAFDAAFALGAPDPQAAVLWQRTTANLTDRLLAEAYSFTRADGEASSGTPASIAALGESQSAMSVHYRPDPTADRPVALTVRILAAGKPGRTAYQRQTLQPTAGVTWTAIPSINANLAAERWFKAGSQSRSAWAARAYAGYGEGYGPNPGRTSWTHWSAFGEVAVVGTHRRDLFAGTEARVGQGFALSDTTRATIAASLWGMVQHDDRTRHRLEIGPGLAIDTWLGDVPAQLRLDYRQRLSAVPRTSNSVTLTVAFTL